MKTTERRSKMTETTHEAGPTLFGGVVLDLMRERELADASELDLDRLDLRALRRHFDGENAQHRRRMPAHVADALEASDEEMVRMAVAYMGYSPQLLNA
jgi:hypothetical protein